MSATGTGGARSIDFKEVLILLVLATVTIISGVEVVQTLGEAYAEPPRGISYNLFFLFGGLLGLSPGGTAVFAATFFLGLLVLLTLDEYRRYNGAFLLIVSVIGLGVLSGFGLFQIAWLDHLPAATIGLAGGLFFGGRGPGSSGAFHDLFDTTGATSRLEFPGAIWWVYALVSLVAVLSLVEGTFVYESPLLYRFSQLSIRDAEFVGFDNSGLLVEIVATALFLFCISVFRDVTADKNVTLIGATGTGKTATMAGLAKAVDRYTDGTYYLNSPLEYVRDELEEEAEIDATPTDTVLPFEMTFKHGRLLPRKVTIRVIDYAGDRLEPFEPTDRSNAATGGIEQASAVAGHIYNNSITDTDRGYPIDDDTIDPERVSALEDLSGDERAVELLQDVVAYSDAVGLLYPMDDYAEVVVDANQEPKYVEVDRSENGHIDNPRTRESYVSTMQQIAKSYDDTKDVFVVATKADIVREYCEFDPATDPESDWEGFGDTVASDCIGNDAPDEANATIPTHFVVEDGEPPGDGEEVMLDTDPPDDRYALRGAGHLLDRVGDTRLGQLLGGGRE